MNRRNSPRKLGSSQAAAKLRLLVGGLFRWDGVSLTTQTLQIEAALVAVGHPKVPLGRSHKVSSVCGVERGTHQTCGGCSPWTFIASSGALGTPLHHEESHYLVESVISSGDATKYCLKLASRTLKGLV